MLRDPRTGSAKYFKSIEIDSINYTPKSLGEGVILP